MSPLGGNDSFGSCAAGTILPKGENVDFGGGDNDNDVVVDYSDDITIMVMMVMMMMMMLSQRMMVGQ